MNSNLLLIIVEFIELFRRFKAIESKLVSVRF